VDESPVVELVNSKDENSNKEIKIQEKEGWKEEKGKIKKENV
jgi:hypothetical protein